VLITGHYDSATSAPGAADNGVSVAAMLESMRALEAGKPLKNDTVFLFTDGEELGGAGAEAFASEHPAAHRVGVAFVFESWPDSGPTEMRTTSPEDAWLVRQLANASPPVFTNSVYNTSDRARLGNDFAAFPPAGILGPDGPPIATIRAWASTTAGTGRSFLRERKGRERGLSCAAGSTAGRDY
jgi:Zn-dependent M28 family amino/carboxypeptidase